MAFERRHVEHFGADLARGPVLSGQPEVAAVQIAAALAQVRSPLLRSDSEIESHAQFIRALADVLFPDYASSLRFTVGDESADTVRTQIRVDTGNYALLHLWLADGGGEGETGTTPDDVTFNSGTVVQTITASKQYLVLVPATGILSVDVEYSGDHTWYWAAARQGRVFYSNGLYFNT